MTNKCPVCKRVFNKVSSLSLLPDEEPPAAIEEGGGDNGKKGKKRKAAKAAPKAAKPKKPKAVKTVRIKDKEQYVEPNYGGHGGGPDRDMLAFFTMMAAHGFVT